ncbi:MAG: cytochrome c [Bryobacteraceae bacterium]
MWTRSALALVLFASMAVAQRSGRYGLGRTPNADEVGAWDISVLPDGKGLPAGGGTAAEGKEVYDSKCKRCHGDDAKGGDEAALTGGKNTLRTPKPLKTVGSYWPYATTLFDYVRRAMPFKNPGTLSNDQVYAVSAYILELNGIIKAGDRMDAKTLPKVLMPNRNGFVPDTRPDTLVRRP